MRQQPPGWWIYADVANQYALTADAGGTRVILVCGGHGKQLFEIDMGPHPSAAIILGELIEHQAVHHPRERTVTTAGQLAEDSGIPVSTVRHHCRSGLIDGAYLVERTWVIPQPAADRWAAEHTPYAALRKTAEAPDDPPRASDATTKPTPSEKKGQRRP